MLDDGLKLESTKATEPHPQLPSTMAEISEPPNPASSDFDPKTMRTTKPGSKRLFLTLSVLICFLIGFPFLWKSVEIYRSPLPFDDMDTQIQSHAFNFPCHFQAIFINNSSSSTNLDPHRLQDSLLAQTTKLTSQTPHCGTCASNFTLSVTVKDCTQSPSSEFECGEFAAVDFGGGDNEAVDEALQSVLGAGGYGRKAYSVVVVVEEEGDEEVRAVVGKYRHGWIVGVRVEGMVERAAEMFVKVFANGGREEEGAVPGEFMPVGADGRIVLSFNLLNANPQDWIFDW